MTIEFESCGTRRCPMDGCEKLLPSQQYCCRRHFCQLFRDERAEIYRVWYLWLNGELSTVQLREVQNIVLDAWRLRNAKKLKKPGRPR